MKKEISNLKNLLFRLKKGLEIGYTLNEPYLLPSSISFLFPYVKNEKEIFLFFSKDLKNFNSLSNVLDSFHVFRE